MTFSIPTNLILLAILFFFLFQSTRSIGHKIRNVAFLLFKNKKLGLYFYHLLFLPGVIFHELSHFLVAALFNIQTGEIKIFPEEADEDEGTRLGSIEVAKADPIRMGLVAIAPFAVSLAVLFIIVKIAVNPTEPSLASALTAWFNYLKSFPSRPWQVILVSYGLLTISNTMFLSKEDLRAGLVLLGFLIIVLFAVYHFAGPEALVRTLSYLTIFNTALFLAFLVNLSFLLTLSLLEKILLFFTRSRNG